MTKQLSAGRSDRAAVSVPALVSPPALTALKPAHVEDFARLAGDPAVAGPVGFRLPFTVADAEAFVRGRRIAAQHRQAFTFAIIADGGEFVGSCTLHSFCSEMRSAEIGFWVGRPYWGRGIATLAVRKLVTCARQHSLFIRLTAKTRDTNTKAESVLTKCGFRYRYSNPDMELGDTVRIMCFDLDLWSKP
jgi:RimJ/RimL family protein N-acetyltransferase